MKRLDIKKYFFGTLYVVCIGIILGCLLLIGKYTMPKREEGITKYVSDKVVEMDDTTVTVNKPTNETVNHPYLIDDIRIAKGYYDKSSSEEDKVKSLLFYKNTYMCNTGILYDADKTFDVVSVLDGTVTSITKDNILGNVVEIMHTNELISVYECLSDVNVKVGDKVKQNDVIGKSGKVNIDKGYENALLFEVNYKGSIINPEMLYNMKISEILSE